MDARSGYVKRSGRYLAFSVLGSGPVDVLYVSTSTISIDALDEEFHVAHYFQRLAGFARLIRFDVRGVGGSDPLDPAQPPTVEETARDVRALVEAECQDGVVIVADAGGGPVAIEFAATWPSLVRRLVLVNSFARVVAADDYPDGHPRGLVDSFLAQNTDPDAAWSPPELDGRDDLALIAPSLSDNAAYRAWWLRAGRAASPATARAIVEMTVFADVRSRLAKLSMPVLVLHRKDCLFMPVALGRYVADHAPQATFVELPGADYAPWAGESDALVDEIEEFVTGTRRVSQAERVLATVLFTDIVGSTERAVAAGDGQWRDTLDQFRALVRTELVQHQGREVNTRGDDFLATFDAPARAVACAVAISRGAGSIGVDVRSGVHTGEVQLQGDDIAGIAVHIGARVAALAEPGEVLATRTVKDLTTGSGLRFTDRGEHTLKGVPDPWQLYAVDA
ncbi:MAG TPA: adenylate/guanylate cyclase domain-containing protein [Nocardioidaceae bacterium]|nr:adenylate/guanylate cyclase domain-containing protein [Nocardioidaceae bacterium]